MEMLEIAKTAVQAIDSKKGMDIKVLGVHDLTIIADYFVIATATSSTQLKALADEVEFKLSQKGVEPHHIEGRTTPWVCLDYSSVVVHIFYKDQRDFFKLDKLWQDASEVDISEWITE